MPRLLPALAAALCIASLAWGAPQGFGTGVAGQAAEQNRLALVMPLLYS